MKDLIRFFVEAGKLKRIRRKGWLIRGVVDPETIAEHTFRMVLITWILGDNKKLSLKKALKMAVIHDLCEVYAGDTTPYDHIPLSEIARREVIEVLPPRKREEKERLAKERRVREQQALEKLIDELPKKLKDEILSLWLEYEEGASYEGRFVRQVDRIENLIQALEYKSVDSDLAINSFWLTVKELVDDPILLEFIKQLDDYFYKDTKKIKASKTL